MRINHNIASLNTYRQLSSNGVNTQKSLEKLSSGLRINKAGDDAAGLAISEKMRGQIRGLDQASSNAQNGISLLQTAEGALNETHSILQRMRELAVQSATDTNTGTDRAEIQKEVDQLASEITRIANTTEFNTQKLLNGGVKSDGVSAMTFQIGANADQNLQLSINAMDAKTLGVSSDKTTGGTVAVTAGGQVNTSALSGTDFGSGIMDGAEITFDFTAAIGSSPATSPNAINDALNSGYSFTFGTGSALNGYAVSFISSDAAASVTAAVNTAAKTIAVTGHFSVANIAGATVASAINTGLSGQGITQTVSATGTNLVIANAATVEVGASTAADIAAGQNAISSSAATLKLTSNKGQTQTLVVDPSSASLTVSEGSFKGLSVNMKAGQTLANVVEATDKLTLDVTASIASEAKFSGGSKISDAVTEGGIDVSTQSVANIAISSIQTAIETVSGERSKLGALQNRFEHTIANLGTSSENLTAAESRVRDVDMAKEMMEFTKNNILSQAAQAMLAQANQQPQGVLQLLR